MTEAHRRLISDSQLKELVSENRAPNMARKPVVSHWARRQAGSPWLPGSERGLSHGTKKVKFNNLLINRALVTARSFKISQAWKRKHRIMGLEESHLIF